jgi:4-hydroxy-tetrahydrodipicolinate reductase
MRIGIVGCAGRMGRMLIHEVVTNDACSLAGGTEIPGSPLVGKDLATLAGLEPVGIAVIDDPAALFDAADGVIDFTSPLVIEKNAALAAEKGAALVVGTTGLARDHEEALRRAGEKTRIVFAANMSAGVNLLLGLTQQVSAILGEDYDIEIVEMHHHHKVDAPSGTALALGEAAAAGRKVDLETVSQRVRDGHTGARRAGDIGFATLRGGDVTGEHTVVFAGPGERIELTHKASSRTIWARGAVRAALWAQDRAPGLYSMRDVLGFD